MENKIKEFITDTECRIGDDYSSCTVFINLIDVFKTEDKNEVIKTLKKEVWKLQDNMLDKRQCPECGGKLKFHENLGERNYVEVGLGKEIESYGGKWLCDDCGDD